MRVDAFSTPEAAPGLLDELHALCRRAFDGDFDPEDWEHALGGRHFVAYRDDRPVAHASVVGRILEVDGHPLRTGYVEAVATEPELAGQGFGSLAMAEATWWIPGHFEFGALGTGAFAFYERLGWERWKGTTFVRDGGTVRRTEDDDDAMMVFRFGPSTAVDLEGTLLCEATPGDDW
ncbi:MAG: GNAT family N-acetyltransferase [Acidimicrobiia bacterium]